MGYYWVCHNTHIIYIGTLQMHLESWPAATFYCRQPKHPPPSTLKRAWGPSPDFQPSWGLFAMFARHKISSLPHSPHCRRDFCKMPRNWHGLDCIDVCTGKHKVKFLWQFIVSACRLVGFNLVYRTFEPSTKQPFYPAHVDLGVLSTRRANNIFFTFACLNHEFCTGGVSFWTRGNFYMTVVTRQIAAFLD